MMRHRMPIVWDRSLIAGGRDTDPTIARPALVDHLRRSMGAANFATALDLLNAYVDGLLGLGESGESESEGESEGGAMDALDHVSRGTPGESSLAKMFPDSKAPLRV